MAGLCPTCVEEQRSALLPMEWSIYDGPDAHAGQTVASVHRNRRDETVCYGKVLRHRPAYASRADYFGDTPEADDAWRG
jgi:hypothetical protein